jgi:hypothetical protein
LGVDHDFVNQATSPAKTSGWIFAGGASAAGLGGLIFALGDVATVPAAWMMAGLVLAVLGLLDVSAAAFRDARASDISFARAVWEGLARGWAVFVALL